MLRRCYWLLLLLSLPYRSRAQEATCVRYVLDAYQNFVHRYDFGDARPVAHFRMLVETSYRSPAPSVAPRTTKQLVEAERQGEFLHYRDGTTEVYQSPGELVTVMRDKRLVAITNAAMPRQSEFAPALQMMRTYVIEHAPVESCTSSRSANGQMYRQVTFLVQQMPQKLPQLTGIQKLVVSIDEKTKTIARFQVRYSGAHPLNQVTYTLLEEAPTASTKTLKPAFSYVLNSAGGLRSEYAAFQLVDQRKR